MDHVVGYTFAIIAGVFFVSGVAILSKEGNGNCGRGVPSFSYSH